MNVIFFTLSGNSKISYLYMLRTVIWCKFISLQIVHQMVGNFKAVKIGEKIK